jgi:hypothetical protein
LLNLAAIDKGVNAGVTGGIDGESRLSGPSYDLGTDKLWLKMVFLPLVRKWRLRSTYKTSTIQPHLAW